MMEKPSRKMHFFGALFHRPTLPLKKVHLGVFRLPHLHISPAAINHLLVSPFSYSPRRGYSIANTNWLFFSVEQCGKDPVELSLFPSLYRKVRYRRKAEKSPFCNLTRGSQPNSCEVTTLPSLHNIFFCTM